MRLTEPGPGFCHFRQTQDYDEESFPQLTAEKRIVKSVNGFARREWVKTRPRNEALDCRVGALAALYLLNPAWEALERRARERAERSDARDGAMTSAAKSPPPIRRPTRRGWVHRWR